MTAIQDVLAEREKQVQAFTDFDKTNTKNDWVSYISAYAGRAADKVRRNEKEGQTFRANMVKVGALALAAIEAHDKGYTNSGDGVV
jgi:hypothetical protein